MTISKERIPGIEENVIKLYPAMSLREVADKLHCGRSTVKRYADRNNLKHTPETEKRLHEKSVLNNLRRCLAIRSIDYGKMSSSRKRLFQMEYARELVGLSRKSHLRLSRVTSKARVVIWRLCKVYDYYYDRDYPYTVWYDSATKRNQNERYYTEKYGIKFEQGSE